MLSMAMGGKGTFVVVSFGYFFSSNFRICKTPGHARSRSPTNQAPPTQGRLLLEEVRFCGVQVDALRVRSTAGMGHPKPKGNQKYPQGKKHSGETGRTSGKPEVPQGNEHHINKCSNSCKEADSAKRETVSGSKTCHRGTAAMGKTGATGEQVPQGQQRAGMGGRAAGREARGSC